MKRKNLLFLLAAAALLASCSGGDSSTNESTPNGNNTNASQTDQGGGNSDTNGNGNHSSDNGGGTNNGTSDNGNSLPTEEAPDDSKTTYITFADESGEDYEYLYISKVGGNYEPFGAFPGQQLYFGYTWNVRLEFGVSYDAVFSKEGKQTNPLRMRVGALGWYTYSGGDCFEEMTPEAQATRHSLTIIDGNETFVNVWIFDVGHSNKNLNGSYPGQELVNHSFTLHEIEEGTEMCFALIDSEGVTSDNLYYDMGTADVTLRVVDGVVTPVE